MLPASERQSELSKLAPTPEDEHRLIYSWHFWARPNQLPPPGDWTIWLLLSGRGFGKTRVGAEWIIDKARRGIGPIALVGQAKADVRDTMIEIGPSSIIKVSPPWFKPTYEPSKRRLVWPNGVTATIFSGDEPDQLRGPQHAAAWVDELAKFAYPEETWDNLELGLRLGDSPQVVVTTTPRNIPLIKRLVKDTSCVVTRGSSYENMGNLSTQFIRRVISKYEGTRLGQQELHGVVLEDIEGALWSSELIERSRVRHAPENLKRIVIAVDPSVSMAGEMGIVAVGEDYGGHMYVLADESRSGTPNERFGAVIEAFDRWSADVVIGEINNGGDLIESTLRGLRSGIAYKSVHATRGKAVRADPVVNQYELNHVHHVGMHSLLEDQMTTWIPDEGPSPNRVDALVWGIWELGVEEEEKPKIAKARAR